MLPFKEYIRYKIEKTKRSALERGYEYSLTKRNVIKLAKAKYCSYTGYRFSLDELAFKASFERIDNTKGYVPGNVIPVCYLANKIKSNMHTVAELKGMEGILANKIEKRENHITFMKNQAAKLLKKQEEIGAKNVTKTNYTALTLSMEKVKKTLTNLKKDLEDNQFHLRYEKQKLDMCQKTIAVLTEGKDLGYKYLTLDQKIVRFIKKAMGK